MMALNMAFLFSLMGLIGSQTGQIIDLHANASSIEEYAKLEIIFSIDRDYSNPYDPDIVQVDALITKDAETVEFPCFYMIPIQFIAGNRHQNAREFSEDATWMLRYSFLEDGIYNIKIRVRDSAGEFLSRSIEVSVADGMGKGFIRIHPQDQQIFQFDDGSPYYPNGFNVAWNNGGLVDFYADCIDKMGKVGANWLRYWLVGFARQALEWDTKLWGNWNRDYGLGFYNQKAAALIDEVVSLAEAEGIYLQLVFEAHGEWSTRVNSNWRSNPYNSDLGGPISSPAEFFTNEQAKKLAQNRYRYTIARWGYSTAIFAWEFFNEVNFTDAYYPPSDENANSIARWHEEMAAYVKFLDHANHLVTTSANENKLLMALDREAPSLNQIQFHQYAHGIHETVTERSGSLLDILQKPIMVGEFGLSDFDGGKKHPDIWGDHIRKTIWLGVFRKVPNMYWYWDYIEQQNLYNIFAPLSQFLQDEELAGMETFRLSLQDGLGVDVLNFSGTMNWEKTRKQEFIIDASGKADGLAELSKFLHGDYHSDMGNWVSFQADFRKVGTALIQEFCEWYQTAMGSQSIGFTS